MSDQNIHLITPENIMKPFSGVLGGIKREQWLGMG